MFARTYVPSKVPEAVHAWRTDLQEKGRPKLSSAIAHPAENPELFEEGWDQALERERGGQPQPTSPPLVNGASGPS